MSDIGRFSYRGDHELLDLVVRAELARAERQPVEREALAEALAARAELADRLCRYRWLAMEQARAAGLSWAEIGCAAGIDPADARAEYETALERQKQFGLAAPDRADPGPAAGPTTSEAESLWLPPPMPEAPDLGR
jgi:hypothetical protein